MGIIEEYQELLKVELKLLSQQQCAFCNKRFAADEAEIRLCVSCLSNQLTPEEVQELHKEITRLKRGDFTPDEFQGLCHHLDERLGITREEFCHGCEEYQEKLFGPKERFQSAVAFGTTLPSRLDNLQR